MGIKIRAFVSESRHALHQRTQRGWEGANQFTGGYLLYLAQAIKNFMTIGQNEAVSFAYWALFSLFPMVILAIFIAVSVLGSSRTNAKAELSATLKEFIPSSETTLIQDSIDNVIPRRSTSYGILSIVGLIFGANRLFTHLQRTLSRIFRDEARRPWPVQIIIGAGMMAALATLVVLSLGLTTAFRMISAQIAGRHSPLIEVGEIVALLVVNTAMLSMLYRFIPRRKIALWAILPSAILGAMVWELGRGLFDWYILHLANFGLIYGSLGALVGLLLWMFLIGSVISVCAEIAVATDDWRRERPPAVAVEVLVPNMPASQLSPEARHTFAVAEPPDQES